MVREAQFNDLQGLLKLYTQLHDNPLPEESSGLLTIWNKIIHDENYYIIVAEEGQQIVSSCVIVIIQNLTHSQRPYAVVENVITDALFRKQGFASAADGLLEIIPEQAALVQEIYRQYLSGKSLGGIADFLFENHIPSPTGKEKWSV